MLLEEFDVEKYERTIKKEGYEEGHASGLREGHANGLREGHANGLQEGQAFAVLTLLEQKGTVPADIRERILSQKDQTVLKQWLLSASSSKDIGAFREKTGI